MSKRTNNKPEKPIYESIAETILEALEQGVRPWEECYSVTRLGFAKRVTGDDYKGVNRFLLSMAMWQKNYSHPVWMTYGQAAKLGGQVRKGETASLSLFFKPLELDEIDPKTQENKIIPMARRNPVLTLTKSKG